MAMFSLARFPGGGSLGISTDRMRACSSSSSSVIVIDGGRIAAGIFPDEIDCATSISKLSEDDTSISMLSESGTDGNFVDTSSSSYLGQTSLGFDARSCESLVRANSSKSNGNE